MSYSFSVEGVGELPVSAVLSACGHDDVVFVDDAAQPVDDRWPSGTSYVYRDNIGVRPTEVVFEHGCFVVRIFSASAPADYRLARDLACAVAERCGAAVKPEDGEPLPAAAARARYDDAWAERHSRETVRMLFDMQQGIRREHGAETMQIMGTRAELQAGPRFFAGLPDDPSAAVEAFLQRFQLLNYADRSEDLFCAQTLELRNPETERTVRLQTYGPEVRTLLTARADLIAMPGDDGNRYVPFAAFAEAIGKQALWLSEAVCVAPALAGADWQALQLRLAGAVQSDLFAGAPAVASGGDKAAFTDEEWRALMLAPFCVFRIIAAADGKLRHFEWKRFQKALALGTAVDSPLFLRCRLDGVDQFASLFGKAATVDPAAQLSEVAAVLDARLSADQAQRFKLALVALGKHVAEGSRGVWSLLIRSLRQPERRALLQVALLLQVQLPADG